MYYFYVPISEQSQIGAVFNIVPNRGHNIKVESTNFLSGLKTQKISFNSIINR